MVKTVLVAIDQSKRELIGAYMLEHCLSSMGMRTIPCSHVDLEHYYARYNPDAVVLPNAFYDSSNIAINSLVFVLPSESANGMPDQVLNTHGGAADLIYSEPVTRFFCWGTGMRNVLLETEKWRPEQLVVTGNPSTDHWLLPSRKNAVEESVIGLSTTFRSLSGNTPARKTNLLQLIDSIELEGSNGSYYDFPEHAESWIFFEASLARVVAGILRALSVERLERAEIRPHPLESDWRYDFFHNISDGRINVVRTIHMTEWLANVSVLFTYLSASALDAVVRGVPVVSLKGLVDTDALRKIPDAFSYPYDDMLWQIHDFDQAIEYVELAREGKLPRCRDDKRFREFILHEFAFPREFPAAEL
ncbi:MAG: hypothetical protein CFH37_01740, partial [Alphaproteobacteria bacterium MarineAlpha9_Bin7]